MTEESEHYIYHLKLQATYDLTGSRIQGGVWAYSLIRSRTSSTSHQRPYCILNTKVHKSPVTSLGPEPGTQDKYTTRPEAPGAVTTTYSAEAEHVARLLLALEP
jgi:hypothetical protein